MRVQQLQMRERALDSAIWFEDGNIVAIAQNTAFRFHKGMLSLHSLVFRDLFSVPQPSHGLGAGQMFDDCQAVHVTDTSYDFRELLLAIYYGGVSYLRPDATVKFSVLAALARLSHKYQLDQLLEAVVLKLQRTFTTQFEVWNRSGGFLERSSPLELGFRHAIEALNLFRLLDRPDMVPVALYGCCQLQPAELLRGVKRDDGVSQERLSPADLELCMETKPRLMQAAVRLMMALSDFVEARISLVCSGKQGCLVPKACLGSLDSLLSSTRVQMRCKIDADALNGIFSEEMNMWVSLGRLCAVCGDALRAAHLKFRREAWGSLPMLMRMTIDGGDSS
ncbi:hypothetical protein LXA43DRAFT_978012 [Ganoderma leucocontextum]|nr:hypothetical protein LXA43DRAFT_978012 [Ganoderma leucocontextum]